MENQTKDFTIESVDDYQSNKDEIFSHQALVMRAMNKCIESGSKELIEGFYAEETDNKGRTKPVYQQDTRRTFIEAVKTAKMVMICDFDKDAKDKINTLLKKVGASFTEHLKNQKEYYENTNFEFQAQNPTDLRYLNPSNKYLQMFWNSYIEELIDIYREVFEELSLLTKRLYYYEGETYGG